MKLSTTKIFSIKTAQSLKIEHRLLTNYRIKEKKYILKILEALGNINMFSNTFYHL